MDKIVMNAWQPDPCVSAGPSSSSCSRRQPMELLCRSWSFSAFDISKALLPPPPTAGEYHYHFSTSHDLQVEAEPHNYNNDTPPAFSGNPFSFASSETSQMVMARIMSQSREVSPRTSGRLSHSSGPLTDSPPESPSEIIDELKLMQLGSRAGGGGGAINNDNKVGGIGNQHLKFPAGGGSLGGGGGGGRTVGRWLKDRKEKRREETRAHNAHLHAAMSVAGLAASVASIAAATAAASSSSSSSSNNNEEDKMMMRAKTDMAVASAAALVAAQCVEAAESMGVDRDLLASVLASAVRVRSPSDIVTLTAAAATALRGAATLKARALKEVWNIAAVIPSSSSDKFVAPPPPGAGAGSSTSSSTSNSGEFLPEDHNFLGICSRELLARGSELLKRTRKGDLHWKIVSVYINRLNQVMLKMKSRHVAGTFTKKKKNVVMEVVRDMPSWAGRHLLDGGEHRRYFGLKTVGRGLVEFECKNQRQYDIWTQGVSRLLSLAAQRRS